MEQSFRLLTGIRLESGRCTLLSLHLDGLATAAAAFNFRFERAELESALVALAATHAGQAPAELRLTLARDGLWTLDPPVPLQPDLTELRVMLWPDPIDSSDSLFRYRTTYRPIYEHALQEARRSGFIDAMFHNERGLVTEGADHSVFVRHGSCWRTPTLDAGVFPGVYRSHLLSTLPELREEDFPVDELFTADEVWLTNAVRGVRTVTIATL